MPDQPPEAAQLVAPVADQVRVVEAPLAMLAGLALIETVAAATLKDSAMPNSIHTHSSRRELADIRLGMGLSLELITTSAIAIYAAKVDSWLSPDKSGSYSGVSVCPHHPRHTGETHLAA
jgi:hypothetical protein